MKYIEFSEVMNMAKELTATTRVLIGDVEKPFDELTQSELKQLHKNAQKRLSREFSLHYSQHIDEFRKVRWEECSP